MKPEIVIASIARTPQGSFQGSLSSLSAPKLGAVAIRAALDRAGIEGAKVDEVFMGNVLQAGIGQAPARQAAIFAGIPNSVPATTVNKVCGSGMKSIILGVQSILAGDNEGVVAEVPDVGALTARWRDALAALDTAYNPWQDGRAASRFVDQLLATLDG